VDPDQEVVNKKLSLSLKATPEQRRSILRKLAEQVRRLFLLSHHRVFCFYVAHFQAVTRFFK